VTSSADDDRTRLEQALAVLAGGRIDGAWVNAETGLVAMSVYVGERRVLGVGVGPRLAGIGWLPDVPRFRADASHPLAAALRAHLVDHRVREVRVDDEGVLWLIAGGAEVSARVGMVPVRTGEARVVGPVGNLVVRWPAGAEGLGDVLWLERVVDLDEKGRSLLEQSERFSFERVRAQLAKTVQRRMTALVRRADAVRDDLARLENVPALQKTGRLLVAQANRIPRGAKSAQLEDWEEGGTIEVTLDPAVPAKQQAEGFFAKARRIQRGESLMRGRLQDTERAIEALRPLRDEIAQLEFDVAALEALAKRAREAGVRDAPTSFTRGARGPERPTRKPYIEYRSASGHAILVGRGAKDNDALTTKHARPHDLWLHVKGVPGAHVVVPLERGRSCPPDVLVDAATLAAHHSDARDEESVEVSYTERRFVRKKKGQAAGKVTLDREKVIVVRVTRERVDRLMAARTE
jgi:hypothetical protein